MNSNLILTFGKSVCVHADPWKPIGLEDAWMDGWMLLDVSFSTWCPLKGHTHLKNPAGLFKYVWSFSELQALKG